MNIEIVKFYTIFYFVKLRLDATSMCCRIQNVIINSGEISDYRKRIIGCEISPLTEKCRSPEFLKLSATSECNLLAECSLRMRIKTFLALLLGFKRMNLIIFCV
ncbi:hypothetical protein MXB_4882 [Myxobolus squamalis]|nr:hypothetical protein MXB_4882 [Myxobolus squamalis]